MSSPVSTVTVEHSGHSLTNHDSCPTRQTNFGRYDDLLFIHGVNKIEDFLDDFISAVL